MTRPAPNTERPTSTGGAFVVCRCHDRGMQREPSDEAWKRAGVLIAAALTQLAYDDAEKKQAGAVRVPSPLPAAPGGGSMRKPAEHDASTAG